MDTAGNERVMQLAKVEPNVQKVGIGIFQCEGVADETIKDGTVHDCWRSGTFVDDKDARLPRYHCFAF